MRRTFCIWIWANQATKNEEITTTRRHQMRKNKWKKKAISRIDSIRRAKKRELEKRNRLTFLSLPMVSAEFPAFYYPSQHNNNNKNKTLNFEHQPTKYVWECVYTHTVMTNLFSMQMWIFGCNRGSANIIPINGNQFIPCLFQNRK